MARKQTAAQREQADRDRAERLEQLHQTLQQGVEDLVSSKAWTDYLRFASRMPNYSFNNLLLLFQQMPDATQVASYKTWKSYGRQVRRGESSLRILGPVQRKVDAVDDTGQVRRDDAGEPLQTRKVVAFRAIPVFDVSQTDGEPLPDQPMPQLLEGEAPPGLWDGLAAQVAAAGYTLRRVPPDDELLRRPGGNANGVTFWDERLVVVREDVDPAAAVKTLAHELAHIELHSTIAREEETSSIAMCRGLKEVEAESVAFLVTASAGLASDQYSVPYVAGWGSSTESAEDVADAMQQTAGRVLAAGHRILDGLEHDDVTLERTDLRSSEALADRVSAVRDRAAQASTDAHAHTAGVSTATQQLRSVLADTQRFYQANIEGSWVPDYLDRRGVGQPARAAGAGHAPPGWTSLVDHLRDRGHDPEAMVAAGVARHGRRTGQLIDVLRDRVTLPIHDTSGQVVAFTARHNPAAPEGPKYLNTAGTILFDKSRAVFGLTAAAPAMAAGAHPVVVEGAFDALAIQATSRHADIPLVGLAACGTALTEHQARGIAAACGSDSAVTIAYDGDAAGQRAITAAGEKLQSHAGLQVRVAQLQQGSDPADYIADGRGSDLAGRLQHGQPLAAWDLDREISSASSAQLQNVAFRSQLADALIARHAPHTPAEQVAPMLLQLTRRLDLDPGQVIDRAVEVRGPDQPLLDLPDPPAIAPAAPAQPDRAITLQ